MTFKNFLNSFLIFPVFLFLSSTLFLNPVGLSAEELSRQGNKPLFEKNDKKNKPEVRKVSILSSKEEKFPYKNENKSFLVKNKWWILLGVVLAAGGAAAAGGGGGGGGDDGGSVTETGSIAVSW